MFYDVIGNHTFRYIHCQNSAAMMYHHDERSNLGRIGIAMYGIDPSGEECDELKQVMSLYTRVAMIKKVKKGERIGYGHTYTALEDEYIATLPIGYADGLIRANQGRQVYIAGHYYPIVGRICMDQMMVDITGLDGVREGDVATLIGCDGDEFLAVDELSRLAHTINNETLCWISQRVPRIYK